LLSFRTHRFETHTLLFFSMIALCVPSLAFSQTGWFTILSKGGGYSISMPGKPTELPAPFAMGDFRGVSNIWGPTDVYAVTHLPTDAKVLVRGQILKGMKPTDEPLAGSSRPRCGSSLPAGTGETGNRREVSRSGRRGSAYARHC